MSFLALEDILKATGGILLSGAPRTFSGVSIDSRTISDNELFFALKGQRFDGHNFLREALSKGSGAVVNSRPTFMPKDKVIIHVRDTLQALQDLAHYLRMKRSIPVVAITGSNGKTTTKEMTCAILSKKFKILKNTGNLNNHIGLPLTLTRLTSQNEIIVLELGMNARGEIRRLCEIAVPTHGVITNIGSAHLGKLGSYEAIRDAKLEILHGLSVVVVNADDNFLMEGMTGFKGRIITFSINNDSYIRAKNVQAGDKGYNFMLEIKDERSIPVKLNVLGLFNVYNALAAAAVGFSLGISTEEIKTALEDYSAFPMRFEVIKKGGITLINDSYNANPSSMKEALKESVRLGAGGRVVAVLGDMVELNGFSEDAHRGIGKMIFEMGIDVFVAVGDMMALAAQECRDKKGDRVTPLIYTFKDAEEAKGGIMDILKQGDTILIKGSRAIGMERIIGGIKNVI